MESTRSTKLPEGVGKKIVEALKQDSIEINSVPDENVVEQKSFMDEAPYETELFPEQYSQETQSQLVEESAGGVFEQNPLNTQETQPAQAFSPAFNVPQQPKKVETSMQEIEMPANVDILKRLISQLPPGVTRQTGAQIIRQTMEAMGISMKSVLQEAQFIQEELGSSSQDCINTVEEYKNNIRILERKVQNYRKQANQLGELINLFILSDKKR